MKKNILRKHVFLLMLLYVISGCAKPGLDNSHFYGLLPGVNEPPPPVNAETLKDKTGWTSDTIDNGLIHYQYSGTVQTQSAKQFVNVTELDLHNSDYEVEFVNSASRDSLSHIAQQYDAVIGINGTYERDASFIKTKGNVYSNITITPDDLRYWKHQGAISYNTGTDLKIGYGTRDEYLQSPYLNIFSGAPVLIDSFKRVGDDFVGDLTGVDLSALPYEDYRHHQGTRQPRTAVALTESGHLLLITIDGRVPEAAGMTAKEVTDFASRYFDPEYALNMDGGGSTTMYIKGFGVNGVVNYPTDNGVRDHYGQRLLYTFILIKNKSKDVQFEGGDGSESNPYLIATADQLNNMHALDWSTTLKNPYYFRLVADINMEGRTWVPLNYASPFEQYLHFDGDGHVIKNLKVDGASSYASFFGILNGSCRNLGLVNVDVESTSSGAGAFGGYLGIKSPDKSEKTGLLENCFSTGVVSGTDAVGGLIGNLGKPFDKNNLSAVKNCFSTATVTATTEGSGNSRAGGLVGIVWDGGILENSYAAGDVFSKTTSGKGAGGLAGWSDDDLVGLVALNSKVGNAGNGNTGRISGTMGQVGGVIGQGQNCWASDDLVLTKSGTPVPASQLTTGQVTTAQTPYDGETKSAAFLSDIQNYSSGLSWEIGSGKPWASAMSSGGYPVLQWLFNRGDYEKILGGNAGGSGQPGPLVDFSFTPTNPSTGVQVTFQAETKAGSSSISTWEWNFGDAQSSKGTGNNTTFIYNNGGTFTVTLKVTDINNKTATVTKEITILSTTGDFAGGDGTQSGPYLIANIAQLENMQTKVDWSASSSASPVYFKLMQDLDMSGQSWTSLDPGNSHFIDFEGNGHVIKNLKVNSGAYMSMFGVLVGVVRNLGLVGVDIESTSTGAGAFAGYVGFKGPDKPTALIENCFSTGKVSGPDAVGGIAGNIGKPNGSVANTIKNCFSTVEVTATNASGSARAGGIAGINFAGGVIENCFSSGKIVSETTGSNGAGGITGWTDTNLQSDVAFNIGITIGTDGIIGRISGAMGQVSGQIAQGEHCLALDDILLTKGADQVPSTEYVTGEVTTKNGGYDGESKTKSYLGDMNNYNAIGWQIGPGNPWASTTNGGLPILQWLFARGDYADFY